jgi:HPt (histidine-containing phosphotransfer) domain-containing protein
MDGFIGKPVRIEVLRNALDEAASREGAGVPALDAAAFDRLRVLERDAPGVLSEIVRLFLTDTPERIQSLRAAASRGDAETLGSLAHGLKGSSGYIGAREMELVCSEIERMARGGKTDAAMQRVGMLEGVLERTREALGRASG